MNIPTCIKIGGYTIKIQFIENIMLDDEQFGCWNPRTQTISIDPNICDELKYGILIHEVIEAMKDIYHLDCLQKDHHAINLLGEAWTQVLKDNGEAILFK